MDKGLIVRPGDTLILITESRITVEDLDRMMAQLAESLPGVKIAIVEGFSQALAYRPAGPDA